MNNYILIFNIQKRRQIIKSKSLKEAFELAREKYGDTIFDVVRDTVFEKLFVKVNF